MYALFLGPTGFGIISQLYNSLLLFTSTIHLGIPVAVTSEISKLKGKNDKDTEPLINSYFRYFVFRLFFITLLISTIIILFSTYISNFLVDNSNYYYVIVIIFVSAPFTVVFLIVESFLRSYKEIDKIVKINVATNIISIVILIPLIIFLNLLGVSIYLLIFGIIPLLLSIFWAKDFLKKLIKENKYKLSREEKILILKIGSISLLSSLMHQGVIILIRKSIISSYGYEANGIYQSVLSVSISYFGLIYIFLTNYSLPKFSECLSNDILITEININARFLMLIMVPMMLLFYGFKEFGVLLLFSKNFLSSGELFFPQFIGDIFRVGAALFGLWLIPRRKIKHIIMIDSIFNTVFFLTSMLFMRVLSFPLISVAYAYCIAFFCHFIMYFTYSRKTIKFKLERKLMLTFIYSIVAFLLTYFFSFTNRYVGTVSTLSILVIWFFLVVERDEIVKAKNYITAYINNHKS